MQKINLPPELSNWVLSLIIEAEVVPYIRVIGLRNHNSANSEVK